MKNTLHKHLLALTAAALLCSPAVSFAQTADHTGNVPYVTGGIGDDEKDALESARHQYNLDILNTQPNGEYMADIAITISDSQGNQLLSANAGPLFYANLHPGKYTVTASANGNTQKKTVTITSKGASKLFFVWK